MHSSLMLFLSSLLALLTMGAGATLSAVTVRSKLKIQLEYMVNRIQILNDMWMSPKLVGGSLDPSIEKHLEGLSSIVEVVGTYQVLLQTLPQEGLSQLREDVDTLRAWLEKLCPGTLSEETEALAESQLESHKRFAESKGLVVLRKLESFLSHLKSSLNHLRTCSTAELKELEKKTVS